MSPFFLRKSLASFAALSYNLPWLCGCVATFTLCRVDVATFTHSDRSKVSANERYSLRFDSLVDDDDHSPAGSAVFLRHRGAFAFISVVLYLVLRKIQVFFIFDVIRVIPFDIVTIFEESVIIFLVRLSWIIKCMDGRTNFLRFLKMFRRPVADTNWIFCIVYPLRCNNIW